MNAKTVFYVIWWSSIAANLALSAADNVDAAFPFAVFNLFCTGVVLGWFAQSRLKGGDKDAKNR